MHGSPYTRVFFYSEKTRIKSYITEVLSYSIFRCSQELEKQGITERKRRGLGRRSSPIPKGRSLKRMALSASSSSSFRLLCSPLLHLPSRPHNLPVFISLSLSLSPSPHCYPIPNPRTYLSAISLFDLQQCFFLRFFLKLRLHESTWITYPPPKDAQGST